MDLWEIAEYVGESLVFLGVVGEIFAEWKEPARHTLAKWSGLVCVFGLAVSLAALIGTNEGFNSTVADLNKRAAQSNKDAAQATLDAARARQETAQLSKDAQGLKTEAEKAKRDMVRAQLELARITSPIQSVPIINGVARPDPTKGNKLRILLHADTVIKFPKLPKGKALDWTLFITQDEVGQHQFGTVPKFMPGGNPDSPFGNVLYMLDPHSTCTMELTSDDHGTSDKGFQGANCTPGPKTKK